LLYNVLVPSDAELWYICLCHWDHVQAKRSFAILCARATRRRSITRLPMPLR